MELREQLMLTGQSISRYLLAVNNYMKVWNVAMQRLCDLYAIWQIRAKYLHPILCEAWWIFLRDFRNASSGNVMINRFHIENIRYSLTES